MAARLSAPERARRMLAIVPWVASQPDGAAVDEICRRFAISPSRLLDDLTTLQYVGAAPYSPDQLVEVQLDGDRVRIHLPQAFDRPLRLTTEEAVALVAAGRALLAIPGADPSGPLARALEKAASMLGGTGGEGLEVSLGPVDDDVLGDLRRAAADHRRVRLDYYSYGRDEHTVREVDPYHVWASRGAWYLSGWCHLATADRLFRLDRARSVEVLDERFDPPGPPARTPVFTPSADDPRVVLELEPEARWVIEHHPTDSVEDLGDGRSRVVLAVGAPQWLERLLLRLGPAARVVSAPAELRSCGPDAAARVLARYAASPRRPASDRVG